MLLDLNADPTVNTTVSQQQIGRPVTEIVWSRRDLGVSDPDGNPARAAFQDNGIAEFGQRYDRTDFMVPIVAPPKDLQKKIDLGRRRQRNLFHISRQSEQWNDTRVQVHDLRPLGRLRNS